MFRSELTVTIKAGVKVGRNVVLPEQVRRRANFRNQAIDGDQQQRMGAVSPSFPLGCGFYGVGGGALQNFASEFRFVPAEQTVHQR